MLHQKECCGTRTCGEKIVATNTYGHQSVIKSNIRYLAVQVTSFIVLYVCSVIDIVLDRQLILVLDFPTTRVILSRKRGRAV